MLYGKVKEIKHGEAHVYSMEAPPHLRWMWVPLPPPGPTPVRLDTIVKMEPDGALWVITETDCVGALTNALAAFTGTN